VEEKRFDLFISALGRLQSAVGGGVRGWVVGPTQDRHLKTELEAQTASLGLRPEQFRFLGVVSNMGRLYQQADICVLTSDVEGTPNVLLEAMAAGLPVVATRVGGVPDIVRHGDTGVLFERDDLDGLTAALTDLISHPSRRKQLSQHARNYIEDHHSLERLPSQLQQLYLRALPSLFPWKRDVVESKPA